MEYLKKNKVFISLISIIVVCIAFLIIQLTQTTNNSSVPTGGSNEANVNTRVDSFTVNLTNTFDLTFNWNITRGNEVIEKVEILHNDELLQDVTDMAVYSIPLFQSDIHTGNNEFTFRVTLGDGTVLDKSTYKYIDEVLGFEVNPVQEGRKVTYTVNYYYDRESPVNAPVGQIRFDKDPGVSGNFNYVNSSVVREDGNYVEMNAIYELNMEGATSDTYQANLQFIFEEYNLTFTSSNTIEI